MPRAARGRSAAVANGEEPRDRILAAAERCIDRHGIRKTTMEDIAAEAGMSRPGIYRYFSDRDDLLTDLIIRHSRVLGARLQKFLARQRSLADQVVEGLLYVADHARRDPVTRYLVEPEGSRLGQRAITSRVSETIVAEFWDPVLDAALLKNELPRDVPRSDIYLWLTSLGLMLMRGLEDGEGDLKRYRSMLRRFVAPAFAGPPA